MATNGDSNNRRRLQSIEVSDDEIPYEDETEQLLGGESEIEEDVEGEELINDDMENDYRPIPELDTYEAAGIDDDTELEELSMSERQVVEERLRRRDRAEAMASGALRRELIPDLFEDESSEIESSYGRQRRDDRLSTFDSLGEHSEGRAYETVENLEDTQGMSLANWIQQPATRQEIKNRIINFLRTYFNDQGSSVYAERIATMTRENNRSLVIDYDHLADAQQLLSYFLPEAPREMLEILDEVAYEVTLSRYPSYKEISDKVNVRISNLPLVENIRSLRQIHVNQLIRTSGVVASCTGVMPQLNFIQYRCIKCTCNIGPFLVSASNSDIKPKSCPDCQSGGPFEIDSEKTIYKNYQRITIQESPGTVPAGRLPRNKDAILLDDLVDICKPGDEIDITGTYNIFYDRSLNNKHGFPVFSTQIIVNYLLKKDELMILSGLRDVDIKDILNLAKEERLFDRIVRSIAPSIYGHENIKRAIALSLFGGVPKTVKNQRLRGDINVLLCGDPGTGKSQFLKFVEQIAPRCVFTTGQGASAVGLTAYVTKNATTKEWTLEAGALVLADKGVCLIDEFDKMNDQDRTSIHEAMEQQSISLSKAGIVTSLQARSTIIAAANPIGGRYDPSRNFSDNVDLTSPILSRFDVLCVVRDVVDPVQDDMLSRFVIGSHMRHQGKLVGKELKKINAFLDKKGAMVNTSDSDAGSVKLIPLDLLRKYIVYAKQRVRPQINQDNENKLTSLYFDLRRASIENGGIDVTVRCLESMIRLSQAHAKLHLREVVSEDDINMAIRISLESFISTEKYSIMKQLENKFRNYLNYKKNDHELLMFILKQLLQEKLTLQRARSGTSNWMIEIPEKSLLDKANRLNIYSIKGFLNSEFLKQNSFFYDAGKKIIGYAI